MTYNQAPVAAPETAPATRATALAHYVRAEGLRIPRRLLSTLTSRLLEGLGEDGLRAWCQAVGHDWAQAEQERFASSGTLESLADALNSCWADARWGWIELQETDDGLDVMHHGAPIADAHPSLVGVLEGFYDTVFKLLGADPAMAVQMVAASDDGFDLHLRLV